MSIMRAQLPRELHAYGDMVGNREGLNTGAPSITYQGQEGPQAGGQPRPEELIMQLQEAYKQHVAQGGQLTFEEFVEVVMTQNQNRQQAASGGIMGAPRQGYFFGKLVRKVKDDLIPNELKNPVGAIAAATAANYLPVMMGGDNTLIQKGIGAITGKTPENNALDFMKNIFTGNKTAQQVKNFTYGMPQSGEDQEDDNARMMESMGNPKPSFVRDIASGLGSALLKPEFLIPAAGLISGAFAKEDEPGYTGQGTGLNLRDIGRIANISDEKVGQAAGLRFLPQLSARKYTPEEMIETYAATEAEDFSTPETKAAEGGMITNSEYKGWKKIYEKSPEAASMHSKHEQFKKFYESGDRKMKADGGMMGSQEDFNEFLEKMKKRDYGRMQEQILRDYEEFMKRKRMINEMPEAKDGGIMKMADGGMMDMGGMEMDLRGGGFVPIGEQEKADDVPARLSQNEFVFTADAVRGAGGGDVDKGADKMYKTMKELEGMVV